MFYIFFVPYLDVEIFSKTFNYKHNADFALIYHLINNNILHIV